MVKFHFGLGGDDGDQKDTSQNDNKPTTGTGDDTSQTSTNGGTNSDENTQTPPVNTPTPAPTTPTQQTPDSLSKPLVSEDGVVFKTEDDAPVSKTETNTVPPVVTPEKKEEETKEQPTNPITPVAPVTPNLPKTEDAKSPFDMGINTAKPADQVSTPQTPKKDEIKNPFAHSAFDSVPKPAEASTPAKPITPAPVDTKPVPNSTIPTPEETKVKPIITASATPSEKKETPIKTTPVSLGGSTNSDEKDPLQTLSKVKGEIEEFVEHHKKNIKNYQDQIRDLEGKIQEEKNELRKKQDAFSHMIHEMEMLTTSFNNGNGNGKKKNGQ